ncbi:uncharacterized protein [Miscanthus floridulus]|uniref:uncharacterized protein n=1 Tax=Miscanthus floridulus TaxID=154761 RepID=UPI00345ABD5A
MRLTNLMEQMVRNGDTNLTEERVVEKFLRCMPRKYAQIIMLIKMLLNFKQVTIKDMIERLKAMQDHEERPHIEPSVVGARSRGGGESPSFPLSVSASSIHLHLDELRAHAFLGKGTDNDKIDGWYLDIGATHHMTGRREFFFNLDSGVKGSINFGDASAVEIKGVGLIIFKAKMGEHRLLTSVYYILALRNSINIGQLDENGSWVEIEDIMLRIWDRSRRLLAKVNRGSNHLYVLHVQVAHPLCLAMH